jgi:hypothetical protein
MVAGAGATGVVAEATVGVGFMPHSAAAMGMVVVATVAVVLARSEGFMEQAPALGVGLMALLRVMAARHI